MDSLKKLSVAVCLLSLVVSVLCNRTMISSVLLMLLSMVFSAGNMALAHRAQIQQRMRFDDWLAGFRLRLWPLVLTQLLFSLLMAGVVLLAALAYVGYGWLGAGTRTTHLCEAITPGMSYGALNQFADSHGLRRASQHDGVATLVEHRSFGRAG